MERLRTWAAATGDQKENTESITDRDIAQLQSDNYSIGELIEQEKSKLARLETELARTIDKPVVPIILSPCRWEPLVPRSCMGITKMTTACALWPDPGYLTISRMVTRSVIPPSERKGKDESHKSPAHDSTPAVVEKSPAHDSTPAVVESCDQEEEFNESIGYAEKVRQATDGISNLIPKLKSDFYRRQLEKDKGIEQLATTPAPEHNWSTRKEIEATTSEQDGSLNTSKGIEATTSEEDRLLNQRKTRLTEARPDIELRKEFYTAQFAYKAQQKNVLAKRFAQTGETSSNQHSSNLQKRDPSKAETEIEINMNPNSNKHFPLSPSNAHPTKIQRILAAPQPHHKIDGSKRRPSPPPTDPFRDWSSPNAASTAGSNFKGQSYSPKDKSPLFSPNQRYTKSGNDYQDGPDSNKSQVLDISTGSRALEIHQVGEASPHLKTPQTLPRKKLTNPSPIEAFPVTPRQIVVNYYTQHTTSSPENEISDVAILRQNKGGVLLKLPAMESESNDLEVDTEQQFLQRRKEIRQQIKLSGNYREPSRIHPPERIEHYGRIRFSEFKPPSWKNDLNTVFHKRGGRGRLLKNKSRITNAIKYRLLPGKHNAKKRNEALRCLDWSGADTFIISLRRIVGGCKVHFKGMYQVQEIDGEHILDPVFTRIYGDGPKKITTKNMTRTYKFDVATKSFKPVSSTGWSIIVDGFEIGKTRTTGRNCVDNLLKPRQKRRSNRRPSSIRQANCLSTHDFELGFRQKSYDDLSQMLTASGISKNLWTNVA